jgi:hypothetical protein
VQRSAEPQIKDEGLPELRSDLRRCVCPNCNSTDVWKWGAPSSFDRLMHNLFSKVRLNCRRCGARFYRKVIFVSSEQLRKAVDPPRLVPLPPRSQRDQRNETVVVEETSNEDCDSSSSPGESSQNRATANTAG